jgi:hypothetical protein
LQKEEELKELEELEQKEKSMGGGRVEGAGRDRAEMGRGVEIMGGGGETSRRGPPKADRGFAGRRGQR